MKLRDVVIIVGIVFILWAISAVIIILFVDVDHRGVAGDMFGAVNALFSGLAFAGLIYTIAVQRKELQQQVKAIEMQTVELSLQREAIQMQRDEMARAADQLDSQSGLLYFQLVVSHVKELIEIKNKKVSHMRMALNGYSLEGLQALSELSRRREKIKFENYKDVLHEFVDASIHILQYVNGLAIEEDHKSMIKNMIYVELSETEIRILHETNRNNQGVLALFKEFELDIKLKSDNDYY